MALQGIIGEILGRQARKTCDDPDQQRFQVYRSLSHRTERNHHQLSEEQEEQDKPQWANLRQDDQIETVGGLRWRHLYAKVLEFLSAHLHRACGVVQAYSEH